MKLHQGRGGRWFALLANRKIPLNTKFKCEAERLAKEANLEGIELAHKAKCLSADAVQRLMFGKKITVAAALVAWLDYLKTSDLAPLTMHRYESTLRSFIEGCENESVQVLDAKKMNEFINPSNETKVGTRTAKRMALVSFFRFCSASGFVVGNPADLIKVRTHELDHAQMETTRKVPVFNVVLDGLPIFYRVAALMGMRHGLRLSDVAKLQWVCFDWKGKMVIFTDKTRRRMEFDLDAETEEALRAVPKNCSLFLFPLEEDTAQSPTRRALLPSNFKRLTGIGHHQLRHGLATRLKREGVPLSDISVRLGHSSTAMTEVYTHE